MRNANIEQAFEEIVQQYESTGSVDVAEWVKRFPSFAGPLIDFIAVLKLEGGIPGEEPLEDTWLDAGGAVSMALDRHRLDWLHQEVALGERLAAARAHDKPQREARRQKFHQAAVYAWIFDVLRAGAQRAKAFTIGKAAFLLEAGLGLGLFEDHQQMAYGPYDPRLKYKSPRTIAGDRRWFTALNDYADLEVGENIEEVWRYAPAYVGAADLAQEFLRYIAQFSFEELEILTTVLWVARRLEETGGTVDPPAVANWLSQHWPEKTERPYIDESGIASAVHRLQRFGMIARGGVEGVG